MKWLKLDCDFRNDPKIQALAREWGGMEAAGFWTLLLAFVGAHGGAACRVKLEPQGKHSEESLATWLSSKHKVTVMKLERSANIGLIDRESWVNHREIFIPNMLKRVDDYTRKVRTLSGLTPNVVQNHGKEEKKESTKERKEENKKEIPDANAALSRLLSDGFERLWERYPVKDGRKLAERHFTASVKTEQDLTDIDVALTNYLEHLSLNEWKRPQSGKTWFNNWRDWVCWVEPRKIKFANGNGAYAAIPDDDPEILAQRAIEKQRSIEIWEKNYATHQHGPKCQNGAVCPWVESKRPR